MTHHFRRGGCRLELPSGFRYDENPSCSDFQTCFLELGGPWNAWAQIQELVRPRILYVCANAEVKVPHSLWDPWDPIPLFSRHTLDRCCAGMLCPVSDPSSGPSVSSQACGLDSCTVMTRGLRLVWPHLSSSPGCRGDGCTVLRVFSLQRGALIQYHDYEPCLFLFSLETGVCLFEMGWETRFSCINLSSKKPSQNPHSCCTKCPVPMLPRHLCIVACRPPTSTVGGAGSAPQASWEQK